MMSIGVMAAGQSHYYTGLAREDYYLEGGEPPGHWYGDAARALGLGDPSSGHVGKKELHDLLRGFGPDGAALVKNAGKESRQAGLDLTFSAPKSVSVLWAHSDEESRKAIELVHERAVQFALDYLQQEAGWTRTGQGGSEFVRCKLVFAMFLHTTSRAQDMNLHSHVLTPNVGIADDGQTRTIWNNELFEHKMAAGALYRVALAYGLSQTLSAGIEADREKGVFRVLGIDQNLCDHHSKRRNQIEDKCREHGYATAKAAAIANVETREVKGHVARPELNDRWREELSVFGCTRESMLSDFERFRGMSSQFRGVEQEAELEAERLAKEEGAFRTQDMVKAIADLTQDGVTPPEDVLRSVSGVLDSDQTLRIAKGKRNQRSKEHDLFTTKNELNNEHGLLHIAEKLADKPGLTVKDDLAANVWGRHGEQAGLGNRWDAFEHLTTSRGDIKLLTGMAGSGKTSLLEAANDAWTKQGYRVVGMALSGKASRGLEHDAGIQTETIRKRQLQLAPTLGEKAEHIGNEFYRAFRWGKHRNYRPEQMDRLKLDAKTVLVIDESSMVGLQDMTALLKRADKAGAKVVLVGDERQLPAIQSVSPFAALQEHIGHAELQDIVRQRDDWMRQAVREFAQGDIQTGLSLLAAHNSLHIGLGGPKETKRRLVEQWNQDDAKLSERLILAATNEQAVDLNILAQQKRRENGELGGRGVQLGGGGTAYRGDRVMFLENSRKYDVFNGELGTVTKVIRPSITTFNKGEVVVRMDHDQEVRINLNQYNAMTLGYAMTTHKAQGVTVDSSYVYTTPQDAQREMAYVQASRARNSTRVYCPGHDLGEDLAELTQAMEHERSHQLAVQHQNAYERAQEETRRRLLEQQELDDDFGLEQRR